MNNTVRLKKCIITSILASLSIVFYVVGPKFPLPSLFPNFLKFNFSMVPIFIGILTMGWKSGLCIVFIRFIFGFIAGTTTAGIGETADLIIGLFLVLFTFLGKKIFNDKYKYVPAFIFAILGWVLGGIASNIFALPMYMNVMGWSKEAFTSMLQKLHANCTVDNFIFYYFVCAILPFNLLLSTVVVGVTYLIWLPLHKYTDSYFDNKKVEKVEETSKKEPKNEQKDVIADNYKDLNN